MYRLVLVVGSVLARNCYFDPEYLSKVKRTCSSIEDYEKYESCYFDMCDMHNLRNPLKTCRQLTGISQEKPSSEEGLEDFLFRFMPGLYRDGQNTNPDDNVVLNCVEQVLDGASTEYLEQNYAMDVEYDLIGRNFNSSFTRGVIRGIFVISVKFIFL